MLSTTKYQGNGALIEHSDYASSYADACSTITTSNVVETTTRGGGILTTKRVVVLLLFLATANLSAQTPITFTATSPPTLFSSDVDAQVSGVTYPFSAIIYSPITELFNNAFNGYTNNTNRDYLVSVNAPNVITIGMAAFTDCSSLESATFPLAKTIQLNAFYECGSLVSVEFPFVETIGNSAFMRCGSLVSVEFPFVETIGNSAFEICISLENVDFPKAESIGNSAFDNCRQLNSIKLGALPPTLGTNVFAGVTLSKVTLRIPEGSLCAYHNHSDWGAVFLAQFYDVVEYSASTPVSTNTLSVSSNNTTMGTANVSPVKVNYDCGESITLTATPTTAHKFIGWQEGAAIISTANPYTFNIGANTSLTAVFDDVKKKTRIKKINVKKGRVRIKPQP